MLKIMVVVLWFFSLNSSASVCEKVFATLQKSSSSADTNSLKKGGDKLIRKVEDILGRPLNTRQRELMEYDPDFPSITPSIRKLWEDDNIYYVAASLASAGFSMYEIEKLIQHLKTDNKGSGLREFYFAMFHAQLMKEALGQKSMMDKQQMYHIFHLLDSLKPLQRAGKSMSLFEGFLGRIEKVAIYSPDQDVRLLVSDKGLPLKFLQDQITRVFATLIGPETAHLLNDYAVKRDSVRQKLKTFTHENSSELSYIQGWLSRRDLQFGWKYLSRWDEGDREVLLHHDMLSEDPHIKATIKRYIEEFKEGMGEAVLTSLLTTNSGLGNITHKLESILGRPLNTRQQSVINSSKYPLSTKSTLRFVVPELAEAGFSMFEVERLIRYFKKDNDLEWFYSAIYRTHLMKEILGQHSMMSNRQMAGMFDLEIKMRELSTFLEEEPQNYYWEGILGLIEKVVINSLDQHVHEETLTADSFKVIFDEVFKTVLEEDSSKADILFAHAVKYAKNRDTAREKITTFTPKASQKLAEVQRSLYEGDQFRISALDVGGFTAKDMEVLLHHDMLSEDPHVKATIERYIEEFKAEQAAGMQEKAQQEQKENTTPQQAVDTEWA